MRNRPALVAVLAGLSAGGPAAAQAPCGVPANCPPAGPAAGGGGGTFPAPSRVFAPPGAPLAVTPAREVLERLNLRAEWTAHVPLEGRDDGLGPIQYVDGGQVFVQTRVGRLVALDATTGATQWTFRYPTQFANLYPVGVTDRLVFAVNVNTLYCFLRYNGLLEFSFDLPGLSLPGAGAPVAGPVADDRNVYLLLGSSRIVAYQYPVGLSAPRPGALQGAAASATSAGRPVVPLTELVAGRYGSNLNQTIEDVTFERAGSLPPMLQAGSGLGPLQRTPSISTLPRITPPYSLAREVSTPSVAVLPSLRQPYRLRPPNLQANQTTPSIAVLPPTVAAAMNLANLRPPGVEPTPLWASSAPGRVEYEPILTSAAGPAQTATGQAQAAPQVWATTDGPLVFSVAKADGSRQAVLPTSDRISAPAAGPVALNQGTLLGFFAQADGTLLAIDLPGGSRQNPRVEWRANVGGFLNRKPVPTAAGVFASGDAAGVAKIDLATGDIGWRTEAGADFLLSVNDEFVYVRDRRGHLLVYPRNVPGNPADPVVRPLARLDLSGFEVPVTNEQTDRILLGSRAGLLVCLRDASAKYVRPVTVALPSRLPPEPKKVPGPGEVVPDVAPPEVPKKEEPKKVEPKKEEMKKEEPKKDL